MKKKQLSLMLVFALIAGFIGGALSSQLFTIQSAFADKAIKPQKLVVAEEFRVVDKKGKTIARLHDLDGMPVLWMESYNGSPETRISNGTISILGPDHSLYVKPTHISIHGPNGSVKIESTSPGPHISLRRDDHNYARISNMGLTIEESGYRSDVQATVSSMWDPSLKVGVVISSGLPGPHISLFQNGHLRSTLGYKELLTKKTGTKTTRSAASLVLFDEKGNVIWETPE